MSVHETRASIMEPIVREALAAVGPEATALDLACSEGWFAHRLLDWGAGRVLGIDIRPENIDRAELVRNHLGIAADRLRFKVADVFDLHPDRLGAFDVVLCLGLIYHLENPVGALRIAGALTRRRLRGRVTAGRAARAAVPRLGNNRQVHDAGRGVGGMARARRRAGEQSDRCARRRPVIDPEPRSADPGDERTWLRARRMPGGAADAEPQYVEGHRLVAVGRR